MGIHATAVEVMELSSKKFHGYFPFVAMNVSHRATATAVRVMPVIWWSVNLEVEWHGGP